MVKYLAEACFSLSLLQFGLSLTYTMPLLSEVFETFDECVYIYCKKIIIVKTFKYILTSIIFSQKSYLLIWIGMALSKYDSTRETTNLARVARIILGPCTDVLRAVLTKEMVPAALSQNVKNFMANPQKHTKPSINTTQIQQIYSGNYSNFDISLLYFLLRNICSIPEHILKWGNTPSPTDRSV